MTGPDEPRLPVLLVDDHPVVLNALRRVLRRRWDVVCAETADEARRLVSERSPRAAIVDLCIPGVDGFLLVAEIAERGAKVVVFSGSDDAQSIARAAAAGANGFVGKSRHEGDVVSALEAVLSGKTYFPAESGGEAKSLPSLDLLTPCERKVLLLLGDGHQTKEIAALLQRSPRTIEGHRSAIAGKLMIAPSELVSFSIRHLRRSA